MSRPRRRHDAAPKGRSLVGQRSTVEVGPVAHGGHCVARDEGRVVFVRHALPGERVVIEVTEGDEHSRFLRADAVEVVDASPHRVAPPCPYAGPGLCGGCDFQHVDPAEQRALKAAVVREQLQRLAGLDVPVSVEPAPSHQDGLGWRTRVQYAVADDGAAGLRRHRSHEVMSVDRCRIAHEDLPGVTDEHWPDADSVEAIVSGTGQQLRLVRSEGRTFADGPVELRERAAGREWRVSGSGFWQVHPQAADTLAAAVLEMLSPAAAETALDLYSGVGLFSGVLAERVGPTGRVIAVEGDRTAIADARANLAHLPQVDQLQGRVDAVLTRHERAPQRVDLVVLDPPRAGAKRKVVEAVVARSPRAVAYVACDPAALARDVAIFAEHGYRLERLRAFDLFPMTHHVECVALLVPATP